MDFKVNAKSLGTCINKLLGIKNLVNREDEKVIHFITKQNYLWVEVVKTQQLQFGLKLDIENKVLDEVKECYISFYQLDYLKPLLSLDEEVEFFLVENNLNIKTQSKGSLIVELYNNQEAHNLIKLVNGEQDIEVEIEVPEWNLIASKLNTKSNNFNLEVNDENNSISVSTTFDTSSFFFIQSEIENVPLSFNITLPKYVLSFFKALKEIKFSYNPELDIFCAKGHNGYAVIQPIENTEEELEIVKELIQEKEEHSICSITLPQKSLASSISLQQFKLEESDSLTLSALNEFFFIKGSHCETPAEINCFFSQKFQEVAVNNIIFEKAVALYKGDDSQLLQLDECVLEIEDESTIFFITEEKINDTTTVTALFYSTVDQN